MMLRLWQIRLAGGHTRATALLFAPDEHAATELARSASQESWESTEFDVVGIEAIRHDQARVLDLHLADPDMSGVQTLQRVFGGCRISTASSSAAKGPLL